MIKAENIFKSYGDVQVLKGVDLLIENGEVVSVVGASGAGKTTLLQILGTLDRADKKANTSLQINDTQIANLNEKELSKFRNLNIGFIFQFHQLLPEFMALENVCIPAFIAKKSKEEAEAKAKELLSFLGLSHRIHHKPGALSGGEQQRLALARAWALSPEVLFLDEPTANLDPAATQSVEEIVQEIHDGGTKIIMTTHDLSQARRIADEIIFMHQGKLTEHTPAGRFFENPFSVEARAYLKGELNW